MQNVHILNMCLFRIDISNGLRSAPFAGLPHAHRDTERHLVV